MWFPYRWLLALSCLLLLLPGMGLAQTCAPTTTFATSVTLGWTAPAPQPAGDTMKNYLLERATDGGAYAALPAPPVTATTATDSTLVVGHTYTYRLSDQGTLANGTAAQSPYASYGATPPCVTVVPGPTLTLVVIGTPATPPYAVEAQLTPATGFSVQFLVDGAVVRTEAAAPFCLFGKQAGVTACTLGSLGVGTHTIVAKALTPGGAMVAQAQTAVTEGGNVLNPPTNLTLTPVPQ